MGLGGVNNLEAVAPHVSASLWPTSRTDDGVDKLGSFDGSGLRPSCQTDRTKLLGSEDPAEGARADGVHGSVLEVHEHGARDEVAAAGNRMLVDAHELEI